METFTPPFCASGKCIYHWHDRNNPYTEFEDWGSYSTKAYGEVPRFRCNACGKTFSVQTFKVNYYAKKVLSYEDIARRLASCVSLSAIGRAL